MKKESVLKEIDHIKNQLVEKYAPEKLYPKKNITGSALHTIASNLK